MTKLEKIINYFIYSFRDEPLRLGKLKLAIHIYQSNAYGNDDKKQICFHSLIEPNMSDFKAKEIQIIDEVMARLNLSHSGE